MKTIESNYSINSFPRLATALRHLFFAAIALGLIATAQAARRSNTFLQLRTIQ